MARSARQANRRYFREAYRSGRHGWEIKAPSPYAVAFLRRLRRIIPGGALLDLGCGEGRHAMAAARAGFRVMAVDYEPLALRRARRMARLGGVTGIRFGRADALRLPAPRRPFDIVLDYGCLHHQRKSDWPAYLASLRRVLRPGGFLVLSVFSPKFHLFARRGRPWHIAAGAYRRCFRRAGLKELLGGDFELLELVEEHDGPRGFWHALLRLRHAAIVPNAS